MAKTSPTKKGLSRDMGVHGASANSISIISSGNQGKGFQARATGSRIEDSTAAADRPPTRVPGLTDFLRKEYYRRMGIYLNGGRKEEKLLVDYWKEHVSETFRKLRE